MLQGAESLNRDISTERFRLAAGPPPKRLRAGSEYTASETSGVAPFALVRNSPRAPYAPLGGAQSKSSFPIPPVPPLQLGLALGKSEACDNEFLLKSAGDAESLSSRNRKMAETRSELRREEEESLIRMGSPRTTTGNVLGVRNIDARKTKKEVNELIWK